MTGLHDAADFRGRPRRNQRQALKQRLRRVRKRFYAADLRDEHLVNHLSRRALRLDARLHLRRTR